MASIQEELEQLHRFAAERIARGGAPSSLEEIFVEWCDRQSREEINEAIRHGLADVAAGRHEPADQAIDPGSRSEAAGMARLQLPEIAGSLRLQTTGQQLAARHNKSKPP